MEMALGLDPVLMCPYAEVVGVSGGRPTGGRGMAEHGRE